jgi:ribosome-binding factor A
VTDNRGFSRRDRIAGQIRRDLAELIRTEVKDPRIGMISITDVEVSPDHAHARIFFSHLSGREHVEPVLAGLHRAAGFLRRELGRRLALHGTPQLHFVFDESLERGADLSKLIQQAVSISEGGGQRTEASSGATAADATKTAS